MQQAEIIIQRRYVTMYGNKMPLPRYFVKKLDLKLSDFTTKDDLVDKCKRTARDISSSKQRAKNYQAKSDLRKLKNALSKI